MAYNFLPSGRDQPFLLPPDLRDWLPADHLAWFVCDVVDQLDLDPFLAAYRADGHGRAAYDPRTLLGVLLYADAIGVRSSRQVQRRCAEDLAFRVLAGNNTPDHVTIARFRARHETALAGFLVASLRLCAEAGLVAAAGIPDRPATLLAEPGYWSIANLTTIPDAPELLVWPAKTGRTGKPRKDGQPSASRSEELRAAMFGKLRSEAGKARYATRKQTVEPVFGQLKEQQGARRFSRRGLRACEAEWKLLCGTHNLLKLWRHSRSRPAPATSAT